MPVTLSILYRGPLSSCNYDCHYCPFAKRHETAAELKIDRLALERLIEWIKTRTGDSLSLFFTPWGEALTRRWYQAAICELTRLEQVEKVAAQTNLSYDLDWIENANTSRLALWCTFHPSQTTRARFLSQSRRLTELGVAHSVGSVGLPEDLEEIERLRAELPDDIYLWVNAAKSSNVDYQGELLERFTAIDPLFELNTQYHASLGRSCRCGSSVISVDGAGEIYRCHFIKQRLGNLYEPGFEACLTDRPCTNQTCGCHIGYVHLDDLKLYPVFQEGILERIPVEFQSGPGNSFPVA
ncbi:hypothetical protein Pan153_05870 [Gimesia panareensis]|uniref:Radical SAM superfamily protein n=1 Tax=Gimesia panareensis TaxID=2527978 RepID=A0A518FHZ3_9PLAN|nr:STM4011 family radical SAM protein [Gimesia panareensis]QDV15968.1 hypothetical protein Pan153_05870 [Gimesia panareensis]